MDGKKLYTVSEETREKLAIRGGPERKRRSILLEDGKAKAVTWLGALAKAEEVLELERANGTSVDGYFGVSPGWERKMSIAQAPTNGWYALNMVWNIASLMILQPYVVYMLCNRVLYSVGVFLIGCNITSKLLTAGDSFKRDDCVVFQMLRMVGTVRKARALARSSRLLGFTYSYSRLVGHLLFVFIFAGLGVLYSVRFQAMPIFQHCLFWLWLTNLNLSTVSSWFPFGMGIMSNYFVSMARLLSEMIDTFEFFDLNSMQMPDTVEKGAHGSKAVFSDAYENYHIMVETIKKFSETFAAYFFYSEFTLVVGTVGMGIGSVDLIVAAIAEGEAVALDSIALGTFAISFFLLFVVAIKCIFTSAAQITESVKRVQRRVHRMEAVLNLMDPSMHDDFAKFYQHSERGLPLTGFRSMGIIISSNLGAKFSYGAFTVISSVAFYSMRYL